MPIYDTIGKSYTMTRHADSRIVDSLVDLIALPSGSVIADIGAGTGNYTNALADRGYRIQAVEPSEVMRRQAPAHPNVTWLCGTADHVPLPDASVDAVVCTLAIHHFPNVGTAAQEMERITNRGPIVIFTFDYRDIDRPWLADYFPSVWEAAVLSVPPVGDVAASIEANTMRVVDVVSFPIPFDLADLFLFAGWQRPAVYLDPAVRAGMSIFAIGNASEIEQGAARLQADLQFGRWTEQYGWVRELRSIDTGYKIIRARV